VQIYLYSKYRLILFRMRNVSDKVEERIKTHFYIFFFVKSRRLWDNAEKYGTARWTTDKIFFSRKSGR